MPASQAARGLLLGVSLLVLLAASAPAAGAVQRSVAYRVSISGQQELTWSFDGTRGTCQIVRGTGKGRVAFRFRSSKPGTGTVNPGAGGLSYASFGVYATATGTIAGTYTETETTPCPGFAPRDPVTVTAPTGGCGATKFGLRIESQVRGAFLYVTGPKVPLGPPGSISAVGGVCPFPLDLSILESTDFSACGDGRGLWKRSWGVASSQGEGLAASRIAIKPKTLLRPKKKTVLLSGRARVDCTMSSTYSGGVKITLDLRYTVTLRRIR